MKKKILLFISLLLIMTNVKALTFNVNLTNIEDKTNSTSVGSITNIDVENKSLDVLFQDEGEEVSFELTITNTGNRAGTLKSITVNSSSDKIEYTNDLPENGLAINGNDSNVVLITGKVKTGATTGRSSSQIKLTYNYEEGSCPEGEILTDDETKCLCPSGTERNEQGRCVTPEKEITCAPTEYYNSTKKICEKKEVPVSPKTGDNILLIMLLFVLAGLALYAFLFKKFKTQKTRMTFGIVTAVITVCASVLVLITFFGVEGILGAVINPIQKNKEIVITVNEEIDKVEVWDGDCDLDVADLTPANIFEGGVGTESNPYKIKTANQLACFAKSVNNGETYEGKFIKQIKNIKLNNNLNAQVTSGDLSNANVWTSAGIYFDGHNVDNTNKPHFSGTYDGNNYTIGGLYLTDNSSAMAPIQDDWGNELKGFNGLFGYSLNATFKNMVLSDVYMNTSIPTGALLGFGYENLILDNITTYGNANFSKWDGAGIVSNYKGNDVGGLYIEDTTNNINLICNGSCSGIVHRMESIKSSPDEPSLLAKNVVNNGNINSTNGSGWGGILGYISSSNANIYYENVGNNGDFELNNSSSLAGISGYVSAQKLVVKDSYNTGDWNNKWDGQSGGLFGSTYTQEIIADNLFNSGNFTHVDSHPEGLPRSPQGIMYNGGLFGYTGWEKITLTNSYNTGNMSAPYAYGSGLIANNFNSNSLIENCYNVGNITGASYTGGVVGYFSGTINKVYNKGNIINFGGARVGGIVGYGGMPKIYNSYNEGNILSTGESSNQIAGICSSECGEIKNVYNRGNITSKYAGVNIGGLVVQYSNGNTISNSYNSGTITFLNEPKPSGNDGSETYISGIADNRKSINTYNLGNIVVYQNGENHARGFQLAGISYNNEVVNSVNAGNITVIVNSPYTSSRTMYIGGITDWTKATNSFNSGIIEINDSALEHPISEDEFIEYGHTYKHSILIGQIIATRDLSSSGNKYNTDPNKMAFGCYGLSGWTDCSLEQSETAGTYTTEAAPDILSIINGDDAFEIKPGETLPTLKVFNN
ncbi:MAG: hypothetical protein IKZ96_00740 [Bacilli bacterium]|nr:hypothetical protein [Bacilli bacterium]